MEWINDWIRSQPLEGIENYRLFGTLSLVALIVAGLWYLLWHWLRLKGRLIDSIKGVFIVAIAHYFVAYAQHFLVWYRVGFDPERYIQDANMALGFPLLPLLVWLCAKTFNTTTAFAGDTVTVAMLSAHVFGRFGCVFSGCCYGFYCDWGLYSFHTTSNQFPVCVVESLYTLGILVFILCRICRKGYVPDGKNLPYFMVLYGVCRFFSELTRQITEELWFFWRFSDINVLMLLMAAVGVAMLVWQKKQAEKAAVVVEELPTVKGVRR